MKHLVLSKYLSNKMKLRSKVVLGVVAWVAGTCSVFSQTNSTATIDSLRTSLNKLNTDVESLKNLKVNGWIQAQYQWAESKGAKTFDGGDFLANSNNRFMIRRGRIKFTYAMKNTQYVLQVNATERGVNLVDFFAKVGDPWSKGFYLTAGVMNRPYGFEIQQSSQDRETPERSRFTQLLMPNERDMGAMLTFQPAKGKPLFGLKVDAGFFNGTGIAVPGTTSLNGAGVVDFDSFKDFIGRIHYKKSWKEDKYTLGVGTSHYNGGYVYQNNRVFNAIKTDVNGLKTWGMADTSTSLFQGKRTPRVYLGGDVQFSVKTKLGTTTLRGEYITGNQSGTDDETKSAATLPAKKDVYQRKFNGGYAYLIQRFAHKHELALKYEWYDPNTQITGADLTGTNSMTKAELKYDMIGFGYNYLFSDNVKFMVYYNRVNNELAKGLNGYTADLKDDVFTLRVQYRF